MKKLTPVSQYWAGVTAIFIGCALIFLLGYIFIKNNPSALMSAQIFNIQPSTSTISIGQTTTSPLIAPLSQNTKPPITIAGSATGCGTITACDSYCGGKGYISPKGINSVTKLYDCSCSCVSPNATPSSLTTQNQIKINTSPLSTTSPQITPITTINTSIPQTIPTVTPPTKITPTQTVSSPLTITPTIPSGISTTTPKVSLPVTTSATTPITTTPSTIKITSPQLPTTQGIISTTPNTPATQINTNLNTVSIPPILGGVNAIPTQAGLNNTKPMGQLNTNTCLISTNFVINGEIKTFYLDPCGPNKEKCCIRGTIPTTAGGSNIPLGNKDPLSKITSENKDVTMGGVCTEGDTRCNKDGQTLEYCKGGTWQSKKCYGLNNDGLCIRLSATQKESGIFTPEITQFFNNTSRSVCVAKECPQGLLSAPFCIGNDLITCTQTIAEGNKEVWNISPGTDIFAPIGRTCSNGCQNGACIPDPVKICPDLGEGYRYISKTSGGDIPRYATWWTWSDESIAKYFSGKTKTSLQEESCWYICEDGYDMISDLSSPIKEPCKKITKTTTCTDETTNKTAFPTSYQTNSHNSIVGGRVFITTKLSNGKQETITETDSCINATQMKNFYCENNEGKSEILLCPTGRTCKTDPRTNIGWCALN